MNFLKSPYAILLASGQELIYCSNISSGWNVHSNEMIVCILECSAQHRKRLPVDSEISVIDRSVALKENPIRGMPTSGNHALEPQSIVCFLGFDHIVSANSKQEKRAIQYSKPPRSHLLSPEAFRLDPPLIIRIHVKLHLDLVG